MVDFAIPLPTVCDKHTDCSEADAWAARFGRTVDHVNRAPGIPAPYGRPVCAVPGCTSFVVEWGCGHEGHVVASHDASA